jgi:hypothetical protein
MSASTSSLELGKAYTNLSVLDFRFACYGVSTTNFVTCLGAATDFKMWRGPDKLSLNFLTARPGDF